MRITHLLLSGFVGVFALLPFSTYATTTADLTTFPRFVGENAGDFASSGMSATGDFNADGFMDILIGAHANDTAGTDNGTVYLFYGNEDMTTLTEDVDLSVADAKFTGSAANDYLGYLGATNAGDVNGDGFDDILVGSYGDDAGGEDAGASYIFYGKSTNYSGTISATTANVKFVGENASDFAHRVHTLGDMNGDGFADVLISAVGEDTGGSAAGAVYVVYGSSTLSGTIDLANANVKFVGENASDFMYPGVNNGDLNGDGLTDVVLVNSHDDTGGNEAGAVYIFYGKSGSSQLAGTYDLSIANVKIIGEEPSYTLKNASIGDVDGDGIGDVVVGAAGSYNSSSGTVYLFYGKSGSSQLAGTVDASTANAKLVGAASTLTGAAVFAGSDVNGDGNADIAVVGSGAVSVYYGKSGMDFLVADQTYTYSIEGLLVYIGYYGLSAGDVNGDGFADLLISSGYDSAGGENAGAAYLVQFASPFQDVDPNENDVFDTYVSEVTGGTDGTVSITYTDGSLFTYPVFDITTEEETVIQQYQESGYLLALHPNGQTIALVNAYNGEVLSTETVSENVAFENTTLIQKNLQSKQDDNVEAVIVNVDGRKVQLSIVLVNTEEQTLELAAKKRFKQKGVVGENTSFTKERITLRSARNKALIIVSVKKSYEMVVIKEGTKKKDKDGKGGKDDKPGKGKGKKNNKGPRR